MIFDIMLRSKFLKASYYPPAAGQNGEMDLDSEWLKEGFAILLCDPYYYYGGS
jgi:hypothetical protein